MNFCFANSFPWDPTEKSPTGRCKKSKVGICCSRGRGVGQRGKGSLFLPGSGEWGVCWHYRMVWAGCHAEGHGRMKGKNRLLLWLETTQNLVLHYLKSYDLLLNVCLNWSTSVTTMCLLWRSSTCCSEWFHICVSIDTHIRICTHKAFFFSARSPFI